MRQPLRFAGWRRHWIFPSLNVPVIRHVAGHPVLRDSASAWSRMRLQVLRRLCHASAESSVSTTSKHDPAAAVDLVNAQEEDAYWRRSFWRERYYSAGLDYEDYAPPTALVTSATPSTVVSTMMPSDHCGPTGNASRAIPGLVCTRPGWRCARVGPHGGPGCMCQACVRHQAGAPPDSVDQAQEGKSLGPGPGPGDPAGRTVQE
jgi:hypothetical protein